MFTTFPLHLKFLNASILLRFTIFHLCFSFVVCQGDDWYHHHQSFFSETFDSFCLLWISVALSDKLKQRNSQNLICPGQTKLFRLGESAMTWHLHPGIFLELGTILHSSIVKHKTRWRKIRTFLYVCIVNERIDNYYTVPCIKQKYWLTFHTCMFR